MNSSDCLKRLKELDRRGEIELAVELCSSGSCSDEEHCQRYLGWFYAEQGDFERAASLYVKAASKGSSEAVTECWKCVHQIEKNLGKERAMSLCLSEPLCSHIDFQRYLAKAYFSMGNMDETLHWSIKMAEHGRADDIFYVATLYLSRNEPANAIHYLERAANLGLPRANQMLGEIYGFGLGVTKNNQIAQRYYRQSADHGLLLSRLRLLHMERKNGGLGENIKFAGLLPWLICKAFLLRWRNPQDPRLADIRGLQQTTHSGSN